MKLTVSCFFPMFGGCSLGIMSARVVFYRHEFSIEGKDCFESLRNFIHEADIK